MSKAPQLRTVVWVVEYRSPALGSSCVDDDAIGAYLVDKTEESFPDGDLAPHDWRDGHDLTPQRLELMPEGLEMSPFVGPEDPLYARRPRYLVVWRFAAEHDFDPGSVVSDERGLGSTLVDHPGVYLMSRWDGRAQLLSALEDAGRMRDVEDAWLPAWLLTLVITDADGELENRKLIICRGATAAAAWEREGRQRALALVAEAQQDEDELLSLELDGMNEEDRSELVDGAGEALDGPQMKLHSVLAVSCEEGFAELFEEDPESWEEELGDGLGRRLVDMTGKVLRSWRDVGPVQERQAVTVLEYRALLPGAPGMFNEPVRWSDVLIEPVLAVGDDLAGYGDDARAALMTGQPVYDSAGVQRPTWIAPDSPGYEGETRYLVRWVFTVYDAEVAEELREVFGPAISRELDDQVDDYEDEDEAPDTTFVERDSAREALLQHLLESPWRSDTAGMGPTARVADVPQVTSEAAAAAYLPFDPWTFTSMLPAQEHQLAQIISVHRTTITDSDVAEWPTLGGFTGEPGYRVTCTIGTADARQWSTREGLYEQMTDRLVEAYAARALARLAQLTVAGRGSPVAAPENVQTLLDLRLPGGHGQVYGTAGADGLYLGEYGLKGQRWWLLDLDRSVLEGLAGHVSEHWLPRGDNPAAADLRDSWNPFIWR